VWLLFTFVGASRGHLCDITAFLFDCQSHGCDGGSDQQSQQQQQQQSSSSSSASSSSRSNGLTEPRAGSLSLLPASEFSFSSVQHCHICNQLFWGLVNNGYQCQGRSGRQNAHTVTHRYSHAFQFCLAPDVERLHDVF